MSKRGGKRPGAGAPKGNINALRTGTHCERLQELIEQAGTDGVWVLDKQRKKIVFLPKKEDMHRLKDQGLGV